MSPNALDAFSKRADPRHKRRVYLPKRAYQARGSKRAYQGWEETL